MRKAWLRHLGNAMIAAIFIQLAGVLVAIELYPGYDFFGQMLSALGVWGVSFYSALVFNTVVVVGGVVFAAWFYSVAPGKAAKLAGVGAGLSLALLGVFPMDHWLHVPATLLWFVCMPVAVTLFSIKAKKLPAVYRAFGLVAALLAIATLASTGSAYGPFVQKITVMATNVLWPLLIVEKLQPR
ncbi:MAG: DUF998 domain-containing protein [Candidatus Diapherotrites archaeon]|nr:DUF998 domain-containing protein [Candidatus Diapherotrites archaeon]